MQVTNDDIAGAFDEIADLLDIEGADPFRIRAYRNAARTIRGLTRELSVMIEQGQDLTKLPFIGKVLAVKINEMITTGRVKALDKLHREVPPSLENLLKVPGLGARRVHRLYYDLGIENMDQLGQAARDGRLRQLPGFGVKTEQKILKTIKNGVTLP